MSLVPTREDEILARSHKRNLRGCRMITGKGNKRKQIFAKYYFTVMPDISCEMHTIICIVYILSYK